jgi:glycosyltransferase involved in cell wall biosynthesis
VSPQPLVSGIMPTANRRAFVPRAIDYFLRQDYQPKELIIVDDGSDPIGDLLPADERIRYVRLSTTMTVGAKRNLACERARGEVIAHWDDDDWHASHRLRYQVEALLRSGADVCGLTTLLFYDVRTGRAWRYVYPVGQRFWLSGSTLCYRRAFWARHRFANINVGEDAQFIWSSRPTRTAVLSDPTFHVGIIHGHNTAPKRTEGPYWHPHTVEEIRRLLGEDWRFYKSEGAGVVDRVPSVGPPLAAHERSIRMITVAREADMALPESGALNHGQALPWMRRWEIPFALFQAYLTNTMAVLDCTINPVGFQERLARLYPHVLYRHSNPIQNGQFAPPLGVPDAAFDRVICINTLEHLLKAQRDALIAAMARKLKPGGWLILTSDYYFDAFWSQPAFLQAGVMRADRSEIFNGWNKVRPAEWIEICQRYDLHPMAEAIEEPREDDAALYRQRPPYPHACIAGVFGKAPRADPPAGKKIVLALLAWNTRDVALDSVRAHVREARMLRRLGQEPFLCICDNGSTDGLSSALQALAPDIDVPHKFIFNRDNLGSSIARNQIIDYMRACDADYLLLMDGDIEIVPFSSFAMLRYMENSGHRLGCIGADSLGQTPHRERASPFFYSIDGCRMEITNLVAWTQYGMFRRAVFEDGVRFDESRPFDGAGWGFEDNDLAFQMDMKGYLNQRFFGMTYLHRDVRSSIRIMRARGIDVAGIYARRKQYVIDKWAAVPHINNGPLALLRRVTM